VKIAKLFALGLTGKLLWGQVVSALVLADQSKLHTQDQDSADTHHNGADGVTTNISVGSIRGAVDLTSNGASNVSERDNSSRSDTALGVASDVGGEPGQHGRNGSEDTSSSDGQTDITVDNVRILSDNQQDVAEAADSRWESVVNTTLTETIRAEGEKKRKRRLSREFGYNGSFLTRFALFFFDSYLKAHRMVKIQATT